MPASDAPVGTTVSSNDREYFAPRPGMAVLDNLFETVLALAWLGVTVNIAIAVLAWLYAAVFVGGSAVSILVALVFIGFGTVVVLGSLRFYSPTLNPLVGFRALLTYEWADSAHYRCGYCDRTFAYPASLPDPDCPYCHSSELRTIEPT